MHEFHVAGVVVYASLRDQARVAQGIAAMPGATVHAGAEGKLVVTFEASAASEVMARIDEVRRLEGVASAALVYQHGEEEPVDGAPEGASDGAPAAHEGGHDERFA